MCIGYQNLTLGCFRSVGEDVFLQFYHVSKSPTEDRLCPNGTVFQQHRPFSRNSTHLAVEDNPSKDVEKDGKDEENKSREPSGKKQFVTVSSVITMLQHLRNNARSISGAEHSQPVSTPRISEYHLGCNRPNQNKKYVQTHGHCNGSSELLEPSSQEQSETDQHCSTRQRVNDQ